MQILENLENISRIVNKYEMLHEAGLLTEASADDVAGLDQSLADLDKQVDSLQGAIDVYVKIFDGLSADQGGANAESKEAAKKCADTLGDVRAQLDDIAQLEMGKIDAIGDFFGKDSSFKSAMEDLGQISEELGKIHSIAAGSAAAVARLSKRAKDFPMDNEAVKDKGLMDAAGFFKKNKIEFKDVLKQVERTAKDMLPGVMGKLGGFFKGAIKGKKAKPLFGLSAKDIALAVSNSKAATFNTMGEKIVSLGNDISKFGASMAKYKEKEKELQKVARKEKKAQEKTAAQAASFASKSIKGRTGAEETFGDRLKAAKAVVDGDEAKDRVEMAIVSLGPEFEKIVGESLDNYNMDFLLEFSDDDAPDDPDDAPDDPDAETEEVGDEYYEELDDKIVDELIDLVDNIKTADAEKIADKMLESKNYVNRDEEFYRMLKIAGLKR